ncbi:MAG: hypothetical protein JWM57_2966 [Phycisphaerales bacterium]|nr:hypothetical protein [Phycisphaerales bacterium]
MSLRNRLERLEKRSRALNKERYTPEMHRASIEALPEAVRNGDEDLQRCFREYCDRYRLSVPDSFETADILHLKLFGPPPRTTRELTQVGSMLEDSAAHELIFSLQDYYLKKYQPTRTDEAER